MPSNLATDAPMLDSQRQVPCSVSVLIPAYNEEAHLSTTMSSVHESFTTLGSASTAYEIIVCDNNSTDRTSQIAAANGARVVFEPHNQIAKARNTAARQAKYEWLIFLDADTLLNPALLKATLEVFRRGDVCGGGTLVRFDQPLFDDLTNSLLLSCWNGISSSLSIAAGSYVFCRRAAWEDVGGFEEGVYAGEEIYFSRKLKRWGRERRQRFVVLSATPIITSARKIQWYGKRELLLKMLMMIRPGAIRNREACDLWYKRPHG